LASAELELEAVYRDLRSSRGLAVSVWVDARRHLLVSGLGVDIACELSELRFEPPVLGASHRAFVLPNGGQCEATEGDVERLRELDGRPARLDRIYWLERRWASAVVAVLTVIGVLVVSYVWLIPTLALRAALASPTLSQKIGKGTLTLMDWRLSPSELDDATRARLRVAFATATAPFPKVPFGLEFRKMGMANAFALPDGTIVVSDELVNLSEHDDQLLGVLLHEVGHVTHGHSLRRVIETSIFAVMAATYYGDADQITAVAGSLPLVLAKSRYSRAEENEADGVALEGMQRLGKDPGQVARIFRALERRQEPNDWGTQYLSSHPSTAERAERFERAARGTSLSAGAR
jgi:Zn-dependent protease with chaperone function